MKLVFEHVVLLTSSYRPEVKLYKDSNMCIVDEMDANTSIRFIYPKADDWHTHFSSECFGVASRGKSVRNAPVLGPIVASRRKTPGQIALVQKLTGCSRSSKKTSAYHRNNHLLYRDSQWVKYVYLRHSQKIWPKTAVIWRTRSVHTKTSNWIEWVCSPKMVVYPLYAYVELWSPHVVSRTLRHISTWRIAFSIRQYIT